MPLPLFVHVCVYVCVFVRLRDDCQQAVPLRRGLMFPKGGPVCYHGEVEIYYPTHSKCLSGSLTHTHTGRYTHLHTHTHSDKLQTLHRKL